MTNYVNYLTGEQITLTDNVHAGVNIDSEGRSLFFLNVGSLFIEHNAGLLIVVIGE